MQQIDTFLNLAHSDLVRGPRTIFTVQPGHLWIPAPLRGSFTDWFCQWIPGLGEICPSTTISCPDACTTCIANIESFPPDINAKTLILNFFLLNLNFSLGKIMNRINISNESLARKKSSEMMLDRWRNFRKPNSALAYPNESGDSDVGDNVRLVILWWRPI